METWAARLSGGPKAMRAAWAGQVDGLPWRSAAFRSSMAACAVLALAAGAARAQATPPAPSQVAPPMARPAPSAPTRILLPQVEAGAQAPETAKKLNFVLIDVEIEGAFDELVTAQRALVAPLTGRRISVADIFDLASRLQQAYVRAGYPLVRVVIPPQELTGRARVRLRVVDGFIERIDPIAIVEPMRSHVLRMVAALLRHPHLTQAELERRLLLAGEAPGLSLNAVFTAGTEVGGAVLVLTGRYRPVSALLYADNAMPATFGTSQVVTTAAANGLAGFGEQVLVQAAGFANGDFVDPLPTRRYLKSLISVPLGVDGLRLELSAQDGRTTPHVSSRSAASFGLFDQAHVRLAYEAIKRRDVELAFHIMGQVTDERIDTLVLDPAVPLSLDRTRVVRAGFDGLWRQRTSGTSVTFGVELSQGVDAFGARTAAEATPLLPLSRAGADAVFSKAFGHVELSQSLPSDLLLVVGAFGQTSFNRPLVTSEQFAITGARSLSGFAAGELAGDSAWVVRAELARPFAMPVSAAGAPLVITPYLFAAAGERRLEQPSVLELPSVHASNVGAGLRLALPAVADQLPDASAFAEWSRTHVDATTPGAPSNSSRIFAGFQLQY